MVLSEVRLDGELASSSAMLARLNEAAEIVEAHAYLTDEQLLTWLGPVGE